MSSSESAEQSVSGVRGGVFSNGSSNLEWLLVLVLVESTRNAASSRIGSAGTDSDKVSS